MMRDVRARDLADRTMLDRIRQNVPTEEFAANIVQTSQLGSVFGTRASVAKGDLVVVDYNPATQTTEFTLNGQKISETIKGEGFFQLMMKSGGSAPRCAAAPVTALLGVGA